MSSDRENNNRSENSQQINAVDSRAQAAHDEAAYESSKSDQEDRDYNEYHSEPEHTSQTTSPYHLKRDWSSAFLALILVSAMVVIGFVAEKNLNYWLPNKPVPTSGVVVEDAANVPAPTPAYPTVFVQQSSNPNQAPSPLPEAGTK
jgi:hypothetical protein